MKKLSLLIVFTVLAIASCTKAKNSNVSVTSEAKSNNSINTNSNTNKVNSNLTSSSEANPAANGEMLKQIETQQLETADPRKVTKENKSTTNQSPRKTAPAGQQN